MSGGSLAAGATSIFDVSLDIPPGIASNTYGNITSLLTATIDGTNIIAPFAAESLTVVAAPRLHKSFTDDPAQITDCIQNCT